MRGFSKSEVAGFFLTGAAIGAAAGLLLAPKTGSQMRKDIRRFSKKTIDQLDDLQTDIRDKDVLLVEDIIDSGHTISSVLQMLETRQPKSLKVCALLDKPERREAEVSIHYLGFTIPNKFVFGYGLDLDEYYRNLPFVGVVDLERYKPIS